MGTGKMGTMMPFGFSKNGLNISLSLYGMSEKRNVDQAREISERAITFQGRIDSFKHILIFSITHGWPANYVLEKIKGDLHAGDIILDDGNENCRNTKRRQRKLEPRGIKWIVMGVSGG